MCESADSTSSSNIWRGFGWTNLVSFFTTPKQHFPRHLNLSMCWRGCLDTEAHHTHIFGPILNLQCFGKILEQK